MGRLEQQSEHQHFVVPSWGRPDRLETCSAWMGNGACNILQPVGRAEGVSASCAMSAVTLDDEILDTLMN